MAAPEHDQQTSEAPRPRVLVVEDEVLIRLTVAEYLRECGFEVLEAANAAEAQAVLASGLSVDVVLSDVQMPGELDGFAFARWVRQRYAGLPVILTSGAARIAKDAAGLCEQANFFSKPYDHRELAKHIRAVLAARAT